MQTSPAGRKFIQGYESLSLKAYPDPKTGGEPFTIGWGHTGPEVTKGLIWTLDKCEQAFEDDLVEFERLIRNFVTVLLTQNQFDALVSIVFNVGPGGKRKDGIIRLKTGRPSTLLRLLNSGDYQGAADQFLRWCSPGSSVEHGLKLRRMAERSIFLGEGE